MTIKMDPEQSKIDRAIVDEVLAIIPEDWNAFMMIVEPRSGLDGGGETVTLLNPDVAGADMEPNTVIREGVTQMVAFLAREKRAWERLTYAGFVDPEGHWRLKITAPLPDPSAN